MLYVDERGQITTSGDERLEVKGPGGGLPLDFEREAEACLFAWRLAAAIKRDMAAERRGEKTDA